MSAVREFEPRAGASAVRSFASWAWFAGGLLLCALVWRLVVWSAPCDERDLPAPAAPTLAEEREREAWLAAAHPSGRGLDPEAVYRQHTDLVLVRAPHNEVLRWFRAEHGEVVDDVAGKEVELGDGNALVLRLVGQSWSIVLEPGLHGDWPAALSRGLHALVLVVRRFDGGHFDYELRDDGLEVERLVGTEPPVFRSTRRPAPADLADGTAILDALLRELDAFVPALEFADCCSPRDRYGPRSPVRVAAPRQAQPFAAGPAERRFEFARCSWIRW